MFLLCEMCDVKCRSCHHWNCHLISDGHQALAKLNISHGGSAEMKERTIVAWDFRGQFYADNLIEHFSYFGLVHDIYLHRSPVDKDLIKSCVVLMDSK